MRIQIPSAVHFGRAGLLALFLVAAPAVDAGAAPDRWRLEWPKTDFARASVDLSEIRDGGPPKDGIASIDQPVFKPLNEVDLADTEPVIGLIVKGVARAYPLRFLMFHEIVNDVIAGVPVAVTFCPLCNAAIVFDRRVGVSVLEFGTTGKLRSSDLVMYDRTTESWWQQFLGEAIVGELTGTMLDMWPSRLESFAHFRSRAPDGEVLFLETLNPFRAYGMNPYAGYDGLSQPPLYDGSLPEGIPALARVVAVGNQAWSLDLLRRQGTVTAEGLVIRWEAGQNSALDSAMISRGRDVGNVTVQRRGAGGLEDVVHDVTFAFVFHAFRPDGTIHK